MNKTQLHELITAPDKIGAAETLVLSGLSKKYPWCQPLHMLEAKGLHNEKSISYLEKLKLVSVLTFDRKVLYTFIMQQALKEKIEALEKEIADENHENTSTENAVMHSIKDGHITVNEDVLEETKNTTTDPVSNGKIRSLPLSDPFEEIVDEQKNDEPVVLITKNVLEDLIGQKIKEAIRTPLTEIDSVKQTGIHSQEENIPDEKIVSEEISTSETDVSNAKAQEHTEEEKEKISDKYSELEKEFLWQAVNASIQVDVMTDLEKLPELEVENPIPNPEIEGRKINTAPVFSFQEEKKEKEDFNWDRPHSFINWLLPKNEESTGNYPQKPLEDESVEDLVDRFLKSDPKITPQKAEFYSPGNVAKLSIADNEEFVSETLAGIYEKQGYFAKAIRVYEKLSLKIPGKSTYFASRIKELEALKNNKNK